MSNQISVAIVAIARLENPYVNEWIEYHRDIGIDHFYIFDNSCGNEVRLDQAISKKNKEFVTVIPFYNIKSGQKRAYEDAYVMFNDKHDYMLYLDIDEFFTLNLPHWNIVRYIDFISRLCPDFTDIRINWELYDDNNTIERDISIPVHKFFTHKADNKMSKLFNDQTKSIVKCGLKDISFPSVHYLLSSSTQMKTCDAVGRPILNSNTFVVENGDTSLVKIRHYMTKTLKEFIDQKLNRDDAAGYIQRTVDNRFFMFCEKTKEKVKYCKERGISIFGHKTKEDTLTYWYWMENKPNVGDVYNKYLIQKLYDCKTKKVNNGSPDIALCGSILLMPHVRNAKHIVGCGIQRIDGEIAPPMDAEYHAIRGGVTKRLLDSVYELKLDDDVVLCDPGLLMSRLYQPKKPIEKKYKIGIIPHFVEENAVRKLYGEEYHIISAQRDNVEKFINDILECEIILSSSLHGIIFAHSYGIPAYHIQFLDFFKNGNFKFNDYYSAFGKQVNYCKFDCPNREIPFEGILAFDKLQRKWANPSPELIKKKQDDFLKSLPYQEVVNKKFKVTNQE